MINVWQSFAVVYALMTSKAQPAYFALFEWVRDTLGITPQHFLTDYETAMQQGLQAVFPDAVISGCFFHFTQVSIYCIRFSNNSEYRQY